jgi:hypothetical protein
MDAIFTTYCIISALSLQCTDMSPIKQQEPVKMETCCVPCEAGSEIIRNYVNTRLHASSVSRY